MERTPSLTRRSVMATGVLVSALTALETTGALSILPKRAGASAGTGTNDVGTLATPSDIQFDIGAFTQAPTTVNGIQVAFPPVHTLYVTAALPALMIVLVGLGPVAVLIHLSRRMG